MYRGLCLGAEASPFSLSPRSCEQKVSHFGSILLMPRQSKTFYGAIATSNSNEIIYQERSARRLSITYTFNFIKLNENTTLLGAFIFSMVFIPNFLLKLLITSIFVTAAMIQSISYCSNVSLCDRTSKALFKCGPNNGLSVSKEYVGCLCAANPSWDYYGWIPFQKGYL